MIRWQTIVGVLIGSHVAGWITGHDYSSATEALWVIAILDCWHDVKDRL